MSHLHEDDYGDDGIADGEDAPQHPDSLAVAHELVGVVVRRLPVFQLRLHTDPKPFPSDTVWSEILIFLNSKDIYVYFIFLGLNWILR